MLWSPLSLQLLVDVLPAIFQLLLHRVQLHPVQLQRDQNSNITDNQQIQTLTCITGDVTVRRTFKSSDTYLTFHLSREFVDDFVPVLLMTGHLVQQLVEHGVELLCRRVKLQTAHFALQSKFICFLQVWGDNKRFRKSRIIKTQADPLVSYLRFHSQPSPCRPSSPPAPLSSCTAPMETRTVIFNNNYWLILLLQDLNKEMLLRFHGSKVRLEPIIFGVEWMDT